MPTRLSEARRYYERETQDFLKYTDGVLERLERLLLVNRRALPDDERRLVAQALAWAEVDPNLLTACRTVAEAHALVLEAQTWAGLDDTPDFERTR